MDDTLMTFEEFCEYLKIGKTKGRELIKKPTCRYVVRIGRRVFIHKEFLDEELKKNAKYRLNM
ncbi:MAG: molybdate-binding protein [Marvinbryantia sp.]|jgi:excisionase family DNA binding protein